MSVLDRVHATSAKGVLSNTLTPALRGSGFRPPLKGQAKPSYQAVSQTSQADRTAKVAGYGNRLMLTAKIAKSTAKQPRLIGESMGFAHQTQGKGNGQAATSPLQCFRHADGDTPEIIVKKQGLAKAYAITDSHLTHLMTAKGSKQDIRAAIDLLASIVADAELLMPSFKVKAKSSGVSRTSRPVDNGTVLDVQALKLERASLVNQLESVPRSKVHYFTVRVSDKNKAVPETRQETRSHDVLESRQVRNLQHQIAMLDAKLLAPVARMPQAASASPKPSKSAKPSNVKVNKLDALQAIVTQLGR